jgi:general secretion pathway protein F
MAIFHYRAVRPDGSPGNGEVEAPDLALAVASLRRMGMSPVALEVAPDAASRKPAKANAKARAAAATLIGELAVLLHAGLPLDRALALAIENVAERSAAADFAELLSDVREGMPLSRAMARKPALFSTSAMAMTQAGEANGKLAASLTRLSDMLEQSAELRRLIQTSMIYPVALTIVAVGVILLMLLFVVPQFEALFATSRATLPASSMAVMAVSRFVRQDGLWLLGGLIVLGVALRQLLRRPAARAAIDRAILKVPQLGALTQRIETARFARTLGALVEGEVPLPAAFQLAQRTISNGHMAGAVAKVASGIKEGGGLTAPLAAARIFPRMAIGFFRTGEESSQLGPMLNRLADVLDRDVKTRLQRLIAVLTPAITVTLGVTVAAIIASVMSAILGFNDLAVAQ